AREAVTSRAPAAPARETVTSRPPAALAGETMASRASAALAREAVTSRAPVALARETMASRAPAAPAREAVTSRARAASARETVTSRAPAASARETLPSRPPAALARRHVSAAIRREVWARDAGRCAYTDHRGRRCPETGRLELHHREAHALGGPDSVDNLELRCPPHHLLAAEQDFGRSHMDRRRGKAPPSLAAREGSGLAGGGARSDPAT
ncbi:MAG TPA: HNH endonuclease signature motif containing protein, partial [Polyangiaceae bacterium]|nr:HNH endonuclease signature motif containing protein [Polyangiaceae bacterium]